MTWALGDEAGPEQMIEYEALLNDFVPGKPFVCICQFNKQRGLEKALERTRQLQELAERLLDVTQRHARGVQLTLERVDLSDIVREVVGRLAPAIEKSRCTVDLALDPVEGEWDRSRIAEAANQLLANALKYGAGGPVSVSVSRRGNTATLVVRDHGIGIAAGDQSRIFGPFQRAVSDHHYGGFGVGLWIAQQIVEAHRGSIHADSSPGQGATFTVRLPCGSPEPAQA
jgi:signal transduction histidine kinase